MAPSITAALPDTVISPVVCTYCVGGQRRVLVVGGNRISGTAPFLSKKARVFRPDGTFTDPPDRPIATQTLPGETGAQGELAGVFSNCDVLTVLSQLDNTAVQPDNFRFSASAETWATFPASWDFIAEPEWGSPGNEYWRAFGLPDGSFITCTAEDDDANGAFSWRWDPGDNLWHSITWPLAAAMPPILSSGSGQLGGCTLSDGTYLAVTNKKQSSGGAPTLIYWSKYTPGSGWSALGTSSSISTGSGDADNLSVGPVVVPLDGGRALCFLKWRTLTSANGRLACYLFSGTDWSEVAAPAVGQPRGGCAVAGSFAGEAFVIGGVNQDTIHTTDLQESVMLNSIERYDRASNTWSPFDTLPTKGYSFTAAIAPGNGGSKLWVFGGILSLGGSHTFNDGPPATNTAIAYDVAAVSSDGTACACDGGGGGGPGGGAFMDAVRNGDIDCLTDVGSSFKVVTGLANLTRAICRRLTSRRGSLFYDLNYGIDLRDYLNAGFTPVQLSRLQSDIQSEVLKDERMHAATITVETNAPTMTMKISIIGESAVGPFALVLAVSQVTVDVLHLEELAAA